MNDLSTVHFLLGDKLEFRIIFILNEYNDQILLIISIFNKTVKTIEELFK